MKYIYIVDHFVPFPQSEYGGVWNVIAENDDECFDLITEQDDDLNLQFYQKLRENVVKSPKYRVIDDNSLQSEVISSFLT
tara:strand:- start:554 stop:793 length:240 start_codon:yes stop_codon:yes gene_type:complete